MKEKILASLTIATLFIMLGCAATDSKVPDISETPENWQLVDADTFTLSLPPEWKFNELQGIDSYIGEVVGEGVVLTFDFGFYSNPLPDDNDPNHIVAYEDIDGYRAKIVTPKVTGNGTTGVYFGSIDNQNKLNLYGEELNAAQQDTALKIFRTIKIKKAE